MMLRCWQRGVSWGGGGSEIGMMMPRCRQRSGPGGLGGLSKGGCRGAHREVTAATSWPVASRLSSGDMEAAVAANCDSCSVRPRPRFSSCTQSGRLVVSYTSRIAPRPDGNLPSALSLPGPALGWMAMGPSHVGSRGAERGPAMVSWRNKCFRSMHTQYLLAQMYFLQQKNAN